MHILQEWLVFNSHGFKWFYMHMKLKTVLNSLCLIVVLVILKYVIFKVFFHRHSVALLKENTIYGRTIAKSTNVKIWHGQERQNSKLCRLLDSFEVCAILLLHIHLEAKFKCNTGSRNVMTVIRILRMRNTNLVFRNILQTFSYYSIR